VARQYDGNDGDENSVAPTALGRKTRRRVMLPPQSGAATTQRVVLVSGLCRRTLLPLSAMSSRVSVLLWT
jgi:hypothetical protein